MNFKSNIVLFAILSIIIIGCQDSENPVNLLDQNVDFNSLQKVIDTDDIIHGQYIIVLNDNVSRVPEVANEMAKVHSATIGHLYQSSIKGFSAKMSAQSANKLLQNAKVKSIEPDRVIKIDPPTIKRRKPGGGGSPEAQETPWGITRVGGAGDGTGKTVWIIDTGIDLDNQDLNIDAARSVTFVNSKSADDDNGHGTHVAGTIAAIDNSIGVIGVAAGATVVAVKVLNRRGSGTYSDVIAGVDYVGANASNGDVANMSLGGPVSTALDAAVVAVSSNVKFCLAAGNESDDADNHSPARVNGPNIYTISAIDANDDYAYFSNYGNPPIEYAAPGVSVLSLKKGGGTVTYSGTSMAAPHAAGLLLLGNISTDGYVNQDPDGNADPIAHR